MTDLPTPVADWLKAKAAAVYKKPSPYIRDHFVELYNREQQNGKVT